MGSEGRGDQEAVSYAGAAKLIKGRSARCHVVGHEYSALCGAGDGLAMGSIGLSMYHWRIAFQTETDMSYSFHRFIFRDLSSLVFVASGVLFSISSFAEDSPALTRFQVGEVLVTAPAIRDAFLVSRVVRGLTDNHGYADKTVIDEVTDYGGYGSFDSTVELRGKNEQNHLFTFQDRVKYSGSNALLNMTGFLSRTVHAGTGEIRFRSAVDIADIQVTNGGKVGQNIGLYIRDLRAGSNNAAITLAQSNGHSIYSSGAAPSYHRSNMVFGVGNGPVMLEDQRQVDEPRNLSEAERSAARQLKTLIKVSRNKASGKIGASILVADVRAAFSAAGLNADDYSVIEKTAQGAGVRYEQLLAFVLAAI